MVKVDGQSAQELFTEGVLGRVSTMKAYQEALQGAAAHHFQGQLIPCMSNGSDVAFHLNSSNGWRNSTDYFPGKPAKVQEAHVHANVMNNVWSSTFAVPDWDMFQSHQPEAEFHAAARAISGGPIYVCDKPGLQNAALIRMLCLSDGRILRCQTPALPARDCLFVDCRKERRLLKVVNRNGSIGVLGLFHCSDGEKLISDRFSPSDVPGLAGQRFAVYLHNAGTLSVLGRKARQTIALDSMTCEIVTLSPIVDGFAALGLLDKLNGSAAICRLDLRLGAAVCALADGGRIGFYCSRKPKSVRANGRPARHSYDKSTGLLVLSLRPGKPVRVEIRL
jgi:raffinose synthase